MPQPGPQTETALSEAREIFYGGAAGGGKTSLICGLAMTEHHRSLIVRKEATQMRGITQELTDMVGSDCFHAKNMTWTHPTEDRILELGSLSDPGSEQKHQGNPHDFIGYDEVTQISEYQYKYLQTWHRTKKPGQKLRVIATGNPPTTSEGQWVIKYWGPWLDPNDPDPLEPGELGWFASIDGVVKRVPNGDPFKRNGLWIYPRSRTFIPSKVSDNWYYSRTGYAQDLDSLPEPFRSKMLHGDFTAGLKDDPWQVIPTEWILAAQSRWKEEAGKEYPMDSLGVDVARGGDDRTVIFVRRGPWFGSPVVLPGTETPDGPSVGAVVIRERRDGAVPHIDGVGVGSSVVDFLRGNDIQCVSVNGAEGTKRRDRTGQLGFRNMRSANYWALREALDPDTGDSLMIPPDDELRRELCAPRWRYGTQGIEVEPKETGPSSQGKTWGIKARLGISPDKADALVYAHISTVKKIQKRKPLKKIRSVI